MRAGLVLALAALLVVAVLPAGGVHETGDRFTVQLEADGDARITLKETLNLSDDAQRETFERLRTNATARADLRARFRERLENAAAISADRTGRPMSVGEASINVTRVDDSTGVLKLRVRWTNLAGDDDGVLVVTEPFATGFALNRTLVVRGPDGFTREAVQPEPQLARKNSAMWAADTDLTGFEARFAGPVETPERDDSTGGDAEPTATPTPSGFGALLGAAALALVPAVLVALAVRRSRHYRQ